MKIVIAQLNPVVGDLAGNLAKVRQALEQTRTDNPDLIVFPELFLTGYPPKDLLERPSFLARVKAALDEAVKLSADFPAGILLGAPVQNGKHAGKGLYNSAVLIHKGAIVGAQHKSLLPGYDVFDEARYFDQANEIAPIEFKKEKLGVTVCEDAWNDPQLWGGRRIYSNDPVEKLVQKGATILINVSASPFETGKEEIRFNLISGHAARHRLPFVYVNQTGGNDELVFDGRSFAVDAKGRLIHACAPFAETLGAIDTGKNGTEQAYAPQDAVASVYQALVLGIRDYLAKTGFSTAVIGLSGGIDSALAACLARDALGADNVLGVTMPSPYSSKGSVDDSAALAQNLGIQFRNIPIIEIFNGYLGTLKTHFHGKPSDITEENIQARIRGNILMAFSNKLGHLVLSTGNKSELAVGYCTLYGDMSGGLAVLADVPKTLVYKLAAYVNREKEIIPAATISKPPSAELRLNQSDQDILPPYDILDS
ncbi:MAG: NAD+ synthase, partial [Candidatus Edwardsbacteria bacterium]|nr:NAD+ synthase [Candidatus Edwardsbacteria bacterium]